MEENEDINAIVGRTRYCKSMMDLLAQRAEKYGAFVEEHGHAHISGINAPRNESKEVLRRMVIQLRAELLELGRMI